MIRLTLRSLNACFPIVLSVLLVTFLPAFAQDYPSPQDEGQDEVRDVSPLSAKEQMIRDRFERFKDRVYRLREDLAKTEPENAARLDRVLEREGELALGDRLEKMIELLNDPGLLSDAAEAQSKWMEDADRLLGILLERDSQNEDRKRELEKLEAYKKELQRLLETQRSLRDASAKSSVAQRLSKQIDQALRRIDSMLKRQGDLSSKLSKNAQASQPGENKKQQKEQEAIERDAKALADDLQRLSDLAPEKAADSREAREARGKTGDASKSMKSAAKSMSQAGKSMASGKKSDARDQGRDAEKALRDARKKLEEAKRELAKKQSSAEQAAKQRDVARDTGGLSKKMKQDSSQANKSGQKGAKGQPGGKGEKQGQKGKQGGQKGSQGQKGKQGQQGGQKGKQGSQSQKGQEGQKGKKGQQGQGGKQGEQKSQSDQQGQKDGPPDRAQENLDRAQQEMDDAAEALEKEDSPEATKRQDRAIDELEKARQELEETLSQLRQEDRAEMLRDIEARLRGLLVKQKAINAATFTIDKVGKMHFKRPHKLRLADLAAQQRSLSKKARTCVHILDEEGTTIVFPRIMSQLATDMNVVAERLVKLYTGRLTQAMEKEILDTLEQLIDSVKQMQQRNEQNAKGSSNKSKEDKSLLPLSAELKLLRSSQERINIRTTVIESARGDASDLDETLGAALSTASERQSECEDIAKDIRDRRIEE